MSEVKTVAEVIELTAERFNSIAPAHMKYDAEKGFAIQLLKNNSYLEQAARANPTSLQQAITNVAAIGLSLNPAEKLAYLIPRNMKVKDDQGRDQWQTRIFLEPSYMGLIRLATDSGSIEWAQAKVVKDKDDFMDNGAGEKPTHSYNTFKDRGDIVGVYCVAKTKGGDYLTTTMDLEKLHDIRDRSETYKKYKKGTWVTDFEEMAKKTVVRNAFKTWPRTDERRMSLMAEAVHLSNENEGFEPLVSEPKTGQYTADQKNYFDQLIEQQDAFGMYCFLESFGHDASSPSAAIMTSLFHSFPKGKKGYFQDIVVGLRDSGEKTCQDYQQQFVQAVMNDDSVNIQELASEITQDQLKTVLSGLTSEISIEVEKTLNV